VRRILKFLAGRKLRDGTPLAARILPGRKTARDTTHRTWRMTMAPECAVASIAQAGKYLSFRLDEAEYGLEILKVQEIISATGISALPLGPRHVRGLVRLRGRDIPVIGLRGLFGLPVGQESEKNCLIIAQIPVGSWLPGHFGAAGGRGLRGAEHLRRRDPVPALNGRRHGRPRFHQWNGPPPGSGRNPAGN